MPLGPQIARPTGHLMENSDEKRKVVIKRGPAKKPYAKIIITKNRS
jgi:hypothetical protein